MKWLLLFLFSVTTAVAADTSTSAGEGRLPADAQHLKQTYEQAVAKVTQPLRERYNAQLTRFIDQAKRSGDLDAAVNLKDELADDSQIASTERKLPPDARKTKADYQQSVLDALKPLRERYAADLTGLLEQATRAGRFDDAVAIKNELGPVGGRFENTRWEWFENSDLTGTTSHWVELYDHGLAKNSWNSPIKWQISGKTLTLTQSDRSWRFSLDFTNKQGKAVLDARNDQPRSIRFQRFLK